MCRSSVRCGSTVGGSWLAIAFSGRSKSGVDSRRSIILLGLTHAVTEVEEGVPPDEPARGSRVAAQIVGVRWIGLFGRGVEDEAEELAAAQAGEVRPVGGTHHAVAEPVRGGLELHGDERLADGRRVEAPSLAEDRVHRRLSDEQRQELVHDHPVVVPRRELTRLRERLRVTEGPCDRTTSTAWLWNKMNAALQPRDDDVFVVPGSPMMAVLSAGGEGPREGRRPRSGASRDRSGRTASANPSVPSPYTESRSNAGVRPFGELSGAVGTPSGELVSNVTSWSMNWPMNVVPAVCVGLFAVVETQRGIGDEQDRSGREVVLRVEQPARLGDVDERVLELGARDDRTRRERRQLREHATEPHRRRRRNDVVRGDGLHPPECPEHRRPGGTRADSSQELASCGTRAIVSAGWDRRGPRAGELHRPVPPMCCDAPARPSEGATLCTLRQEAGGVSPLIAMRCTLPRDEEEHVCSPVSGCTRQSARVVIRRLEYVDGMANGSPSDTSTGELTDAGGSGGPPGKKQRRKVRRNNKKSHG